MGISKKINIIGQRFGNLVVIDEAPSDPSGFAKWKCLCDCGNFRIARGTDLRAGIVTHCGCKNKENRIDKTSLVGQRFGRLLVLERDLSVPTGRGHEAKWICQCDWRKICGADCVDTGTGGSRDFCDRHCSAGTVNFCVQSADHWMQEVLPACK